MFEVCTLAGLASLDRWILTGGWGVATAMTLHAALGAVGSWVVGTALFGVTVLAASELGFHWIGHFLRALVWTPLQTLASLFAAPAPAAARSRTPKVVRQKVVWAVFNNSNQRVASFDYPKKKEAEDHAAKLSADKKQTFFVQPVKEPMEEK